MKIIKANNKTTVSMTKKEWIQIGEHFKKAQAPPGFGVTRIPIGNSQLNNVPVVPQQTGTNPAQAQALTDTLRNFEKQKNDLYKAKSRKEADLLKATTEQQKLNIQNEIKALADKIISIDSQIYYKKNPVAQ